MRSDKFFPRVIVILGFCVGGSFCQNDRIIFPQDDNGPEMNSVMPQGSRIPERLLIRMKDVRNASEFLSRFVMDAESTQLDASGIAGRRTLASPPSFRLAEFASCRPEPRSVELERPEPGALLWPQCVRVMRCGGCCTSTMLACRPVATSPINVTVLQVRYNPQSGSAETFENDGTRTLTVLQHDRCTCECRVRPEDCRPSVHVYREDECRCACAAEREAAACAGPLRIWDPEDCACKCRSTRLCSSGLYFDPVSCRCESLRRSRISTGTRQAIGNSTNLDVAPDTQNRTQLL